MSEKTRGNWALGQGLSQERWNEIFGKKDECPMCKGEGRKWVRFTNMPYYMTIDCSQCNGTGKIK